MFYKTTIIVALLAIVIVALTARSTNSNNFTGISTHSGNPTVHLRGINASGGRFYINKETSAYCPSTIQGLDCSKTGNSTIFAGSPSSSALSMMVTVPGGQQVYVAADGALSYTIPHSGYIPADAQTSGFTYTPQKSANTVGDLSFGNGFVACPTGEGEVYQVYAAINGFTRTDCTGIGFGTAEYDGAAAWEYD